MRFLKYLALLSILLCLPAVSAHAQVAVGVGVAPYGYGYGGYDYGPPACDYGYYDYSPYACAPYGYYGPGWFSGGIFIGAGPWFHGHEGFQGHVNNRLHPEHGYNGPKPGRGEKAEPSRRLDKVSNFKGNEVRDGHGHINGGKGEKKH
jgi:hypothetical protein